MKKYTILLMTMAVAGCNWSISSDSNHERGSVIEQDSVVVRSGNEVINSGEAVQSYYAVSLSLQSSQPLTIKLTNTTNVDVEAHLLADSEYNSWFSQAQNAQGTDFAAISVTEEESFSITANSSLTRVWDSEANGSYHAFDGQYYLLIENTDYASVLAGSNSATVYYVVRN